MSNLSSGCLSCVLKRMVVQVTALTNMQAGSEKSAQILGNSELKLEVMDKSLLFLFGILP